jgi:hypothetical protein
MVSATAVPGRLHVTLRNTSDAPVHVLLGVGDESGHDSFDAISLRLIDANGNVSDLVPTGIPIAGTLRVLNEVIAPQMEWSGDVELKNFLLVGQERTLTDPVRADSLPAGRYAMQAVFKGESSDWPPKSMPYWRGSVRSNEIAYTIPCARYWICTSGDSPWPAPPGVMGVCCGARQWSM